MHAQPQITRGSTPRRPDRCPGFSAFLQRRTGSQAQDAANAVVVHYEELPVVMDPEAAMLPDSPIVFGEHSSNIMVEIHFESEGAQVDRSFDEADQVLKARLKTQRIHAMREVIKIAYVDVDRLPDNEDPALEVIGYIVKYTSVHDCGNTINPRIVATQHMGGIAQGLGTALYEEVLYDDEGKLLTGTFMDYLLPTANEIPVMGLGHMETPTPFNPLGAKGAGETGTISAPCAIGNAIEDALGVEVRYPPYSAERVLTAIHEGKEVSATGASRG